ncbi:hypothetical protein Tco_0186043 [Tanacetum coccineum]
MAQYNYKSSGRYTSHHEHHHREDSKVTTEDSWNENNEDDNEEACLMASQKSDDPIFFTFNMSNSNIIVEHGESSSKAQKMNPKEQIESEINSWFEQTTWNEAKREISPDEVLRKEEEEKLSFGDRMAYKSYLSTKCQYRESQTEMGVLKNFMKRWAKSMSCKDI